MPARSLSKVMLSATAAGWVQRGINAVAGLIALPLIVGHLGKADLGVWIVVGQATSFIALSDLGISNAVARFVAKFRGRSDRLGVSEVLSTSFVLMTLLGAVVVAAAVMAAPWVPRVLKVTGAQADSARIVFLITAVGIGCQFPLRIALGILNGHQLYGPNTIGKIAESLLFLGGVVWLAATNRLALVPLAWSAALSSMLAQLILMAVAWYATAPWGLSLQRVSMLQARGLLGLGGSALLITITSLIQAQGLGLLVGTMLGLEAAGIFGVVLVLIINIQGLLSSLTTPFSTLASEWHSRDRLRDLDKISLMAMKLSGAIPAVFAVAVAIYGASGLQMLLHASQWTTSDFRSGAVALTIMSAGLAIGLPHMVARSILLGVGKHWTATAAVFAGTLASVGTSAVLLSAGWGLNGAAVGWSVVWLVQIPILLRATGPAYRSFGPGARWWGVLRDVHGPSIASAAVMLVIAGLISGILHRDTPVQLVAGLACSSVLTLPVLLRLCGLTSNGFLVVRDFVWKPHGTVSR